MDEEPQDTAKDTANDTAKPNDVEQQDLVDRDKIDFDPDDGLYSGTAVDGTSDIPGPHENDTEPAAGDDSQ